MKLELSEEAVKLLAQMLLTPDQLPLTLAGLTSNNGVPKQFATTDRSKRKLMETAQKWLREVVLTPRDKELDPKCLKGWNVPEGGHKGSLKNSLCDFILDAIKFYEPIGNLAANTAAYCELECNFSGISHKLDSMASLTEPDEDDEPESKVTNIDEGKKEKAKEA